jgi:TonB-dependent receptor
MNKTWVLILLVVFTMVFAPSYANANSKIKGRIYDKTTGEALPGASVVVEKTGLGSATDVEGQYSISSITPGSYSVKISYLGYKTEFYDVTLNDNTTKELDAGLELMAIQGEELVVTAQAEGQMQAINQQITSNSIKNIVSSAKIQELPESNAAEAVGRLPGVSLQREGGEGNKVVIRGLSPQYNKIQINGVSMASTGRVTYIGQDDNTVADNRSVDLSMISPNVLEGIEVSKTAMADQEADQLGGTVNFKLRGAPSKPTLNATVQGGYNGLRDLAKNYYYVLGGGMRFFDNKLGVFFQGNLEKTDRSSNSASAGYSIQYDTLTLTNSLYLQDVNRINKRTGGVLVLDYVLPSTKIKFSNTINNIDINTYTVQESFDAVGRTHNYQGDYSERSMLTILSSLEVEQTFGIFKIDGSINYSQSTSKVPDQVQMRAYENNAFASNWSWDNYPINPIDIASKALNNISQSKVNQFYGSNSKTVEQETSARLNIQTDIHTDLVKINLKLGGAAKHKFRRYEYEQYEIPLGWQDMALTRLYLTQRFGVTGYDYSNDDFPYAPFIDNNYDAGDFKSGGSYVISRVPNKNTMLDVYNEIKNLKTVNGASTGKTLWYDYTNSNLSDYNGHEKYFAAYLLPTLTFGNNTLTFIPGVRYEHTTTEYTANRSNGPGKATDPFIYFAYTSTQKNDYLLPMIHIKYQVLDWFDIRASYTHTLARPDYNRIIPTWSATGTGITWNNVDLKPAQSKNFDLFLSFYAEKMGLVSVGLFEKQIKDFTLATTTFISDASLIRSEWPSTVVKGGSISGYINSPDIAKLRGLEVEWQSNLWFLPGVLRGLVINVNYTYADSRIKYPKYVPVYVTKSGPLPIKTLVGTEDQGYYDRLLDQPTHIVNFTVGFDYEGFSIRTSMQYKSNVFVSNNFYEQLRSTTDPLTLWDMKIRQKLPVDGLQVFLNLNNISKSVDQTSNYGTGWFTNRGYYGMTADLGISYLLN